MVIYAVFARAQREERFFCCFSAFFPNPVTHNTDATDRVRTSFVADRSTIGTNRSVNEPPGRLLCEILPIFATPSVETVFRLQVCRYNHATICGPRSKLMARRSKSSAYKHNVPSTSTCTLSYCFEGSERPVIQDRV